MNGDDKKFLDTRLIKLETLFKERWDVHDKRTGELSEYLNIKFNKINHALEHHIECFNNMIAELPCDTHKNDLSWIKIAINGIIGTLITVVIGIGIIFIRHLILNGTIK